MQAVQQSRFWQPLWKAYAKAPSIAFCRVPELEFASQLPLKGATLDHCCGDGKFAQLAWGQPTFDAGCDFDTNALKAAATRGIYKRMDECDVSVQLPYEDSTFDLVFNNSALEHVQEVDNALAEISRVLKNGGTFAFNVLNHRYFEWWQLGEESKKRYQAWQPFYHAWDSATWGKHLADVGLNVISVEGYFDRHAARELALLDYEFSGVGLAQRQSSLVSIYKTGRRFTRWYWQRRLGSLVWQTSPEEGAGYFIRAVKRG